MVKMKKIKKSLALLVGILMIISLLATPAFAEIYEEDSNVVYTQNTGIQSEWRTEYESAFTDGQGHKWYQVLYQNGQRTTTTQYVLDNYSNFTYVLLPGETVQQTPSINWTNTTAPSTGEWRLITVNGLPSYFVNSVTNQIIYVATSQSSVTNSSVNSVYNPYGPYNPYDPGNFTINSTNQNWNNADVYLNINNTPKTKGLSGSDIYYLNTGNRSVRVHVTVPYGWSLIVGGTEIESKSGGVYNYWSNQGEYTKTINNGFAILVQKSDLYNEFAARVNLAISNGWDHHNVVWPSR